MEIYKLRDFARWAGKEGILDDVLRECVKEMERGLLGNKLGAHVFKKRLGLSGRGKRGGARTGVRMFAKAFVALSAGERHERVLQGVLIPLKEKDDE